ncbi:MAG: phage tail tape measure protein [Dehalococcoidia bacterium]
MRMYGILRPDAHGVYRLSRRNMVALAEGRTPTLRRPRVHVAGTYITFNALKGAIDSTQQLGDAVFKLQQMTGMSAESASDFVAAFKMAGVDADTASTMLARFSKNMFAIQVANEDGTAPAKTTAAALRDIGVSALDASGQVRPTADIMMDLADKISHFNNDAAKTGAVMDIFGKSGAAMLPFLNLGAAGFKAASAEAAKLGLVLSQKQVDDIHNYTLAQRGLGEAFEGLKLKVGEDLMPKLTEFSNWFVAHQPEIAAFVDNGITKLEGGLASLWKVVQDNRQTLLDAANGLAVMGKAMIDFGEWIASNKATLVASLMAIGVGLLWASGGTSAIGVAAGISAMAISFGALGVTLPGTASAAAEAAGAAHALAAATADAAAASDAYDASPAIRQFYALATAAGVAVGAIGDVVSQQRIGFEVTAPATGGGAPMGPFQHGSAYADALAANADMVKAAADKWAAALGAVNTDLGVGTGGGATGGGTLAALSAADQAFIDLAGAVTALGLTGQQFISFVDLMTEAGKSLNLTLSQMVDVFHQSGLSVTDFETRLQAVVALNELKQQADDATTSVTNLYSAMNTLLSAPTKESAAAQLKEDQLKLQAAELVAGGATTTGTTDAAGKVHLTAADKQLVAINKQIAQMDAENAVRAAGLQVEKDKQTVADATLLTNKQQLTDAQALILAMKGQSYGAAILQGQYYLQYLALAQSTDELKIWTDAVTGQGNALQDQIKLWSDLSDAGRKWVAAQGQSAPSFANGGVMPYTGMAHLEKGETVLRPGQGGGGSSFNNYGNIKIYPQTASRMDIWKELDLQMR